MKNERYRVFELFCGLLLLALIFSSVPSASADKEHSPAYDTTNTPAPTPTATLVPSYFYEPVGPYCVGGGCSSPIGYNNVASSTLNEQSMQASDTKSGFSTGRGRVETTIRIANAGVGTVQVYYEWNGVECNDGSAILIYKLSGNEEYPNPSSSGYLDIVLTTWDNGGFKILTRCMTQGRYVGPFGIDSLWYSLEPASSTPTPTITNTPTLTPTFTSTATLTSTPTFTPSATNTFIPGTPHSNGNGTCWQSGPSWPTYSVYYDIDTSTIPSDWIASIDSAAQAWNNASPSQFVFIRQSGSTNTISYEVPQDDTVLAGTAAWPVSPYYEHAYTKINPLKAPFDATNHPPTNTAIGIQNLMTHEFGHWLYLDDMGVNSGCNDATMYYSISRGEDKKESLAPSDIDGINYQYP